MIFAPQWVFAQNRKCVVMQFFRQWYFLAGRGMNGQLSCLAVRGKGAGFEGGQQPLAMRLPKLPGSPTTTVLSTLCQRYRLNALLQMVRP